MKAKVQVEIDIPEKLTGLSEPELLYMVYDNFIKVPQLHHLMEALNALTNKERSDDVCEQVAQYRKTWADATNPDNMKFSIEFE